VKLIALEENIGFARANNLAAKHAGGDYILLLNPDTLVLDDAVFKLANFAKATPHAGIWGGRTLFADRSLNPQSCCREINLWTSFCALTGLRALFPASPIFNSECYGGWGRDSVREVDVVIGCFLLIRKDLWQELGGFDPKFFMYGEDFDLCLRAKALGFRPLMTPDATIVHYVGASERMPARKHAQLLAACITVINRHWAWPKRIAGCALFHIYPYTRVLGYWLLSAYPNNAKAAERLAIWKTVLAQKEDWIYGFGDAKLNRACGARGSVTGSPAGVNSANQSGVPTL
jgi:GT2 family glycosyltransferase